MFEFWKKKKVDDPYEAERYENLPESIRERSQVTLPVGTQVHRIKGGGDLSEYKEMELSATSLATVLRITREQVVVKLDSDPDHEYLILKTELIRALAPDQSDGK